jgi:hypothetical protein
MLNYMGPNIGPSPVSAMLPPAAPGTMPSGIPGVAPSPGPLPPQPLFHGRGGQISGNIHGHVTAPGAALAAILKHATSGKPGAAPPPPPPQYVATTQDDGSILLHIKGPNGEPGPVVKVIPPIKQPGAKA